MATKPLDEEFLKSLKPIRLPRRIWIWKKKRRFVRVRFIKYARERRRRKEDGEALFWVYMGLGDRSRSFELGN